MIQFEQSKQIVLKEEPELQISKSVKYRDFVFFMQPGGIPVDSPDALQDSCVFVNALTGKVEHLLPWDFDDFGEKAVILKA